MNSLFYICNALDDATRLERGIATDSPAASRKVFLLCRAVRKAGSRVIVISLGRGRQDGSARFFRCKVRRVNCVPVIYLPFCHFPVLSELLSLFSIVPILWRLRSTKGAKAALFYNRMPVYLLGLAVARVLRFRTILDLEDGGINESKWSFGSLRTRVFNRLFDALCSGGALLACSALESMTRLRPTCCCYGTREAHAVLSNKNLYPVTVLFGGTVSPDTGAQLLINAIEIMRAEALPWTLSIQFEISGKGDCMHLFERLAEDDRKPQVIVHGRTTDFEYNQMLMRTHVGLALKPNSGALAHTTFPSKVIEFADCGILVVTTDISDVRKVLADGAIYLTKDDPRLLIDKLRWIVENREEANELALRGERAINASCAPGIVGQMLNQFVFDA